MHRLIIIVNLLIILFPVSVISAPVTLKCITNAGVETADLYVDYENKLIFRGNAVSKYEIVGLTGEYITAYKRPTKPSGKNLPLDEVIGGEVFVLDRVTGNYIRGSVNMVWFVGEKPEDAKLRGHIYRGKCVTQS